MRGFNLLILEVSNSRRVISYGPGVSLLRPRLYPWIILGTDVVGIAIQVVGATMSNSDDASTMDVTTIMLTLGVAFQAANMLFCGSLELLYWFRLRNMNGITQTQRLHAQDPHSTGGVEG